MDMDRAAASLLAARGGDAEVAGGLAFRTALKQARLDDSLDSLDRVDALLTQMRARLQPTPEQWDQASDRENFTLLLAFYLGSMVALHGGAAIRWYAYEDALAALPPEARPPEARWSRVVGVVGGALCVPLGVIEERLFDAAAGQMTCRAYVERLVARMQPGGPADENRRCQDFLRAMEGGQAPQGGLAFREAVQQLKLDTSLAGLERLDALLRQIRKQLAPDYDSFVNQADTQNFLRWVAFHVGTAIARSGQLAVKWMGYEELKAQVEDLQLQFETTSGCLLDGRLYFPLGLATEILFDPAPKRSLHGFAKGVLANASPPLVSILRAAAAAPAPAGDKANPDWETAAEQAGFLAAWGMFMASDGAAVAPTVLVPLRDGTTQMVDFSFYGDGAAAHQAAQDRLEKNPDKSAYQALVFDGFANLPSGRTDALTVDLRCYGGGLFSGRKALALKVACPYRNAKDAQGFAIFSPKVLECSAPKAQQAGLLRRFYQGVDRFKADGFAWDRHLDESI